MPRPVPHARRDDYPEDERHLYDAAVAYRIPDATPGEDHEIGPDFGQVLHSPAFLRLLTLGEWTVRTRANDRGGYSHADREFVDQVLSADLETNCINAIHIPDGLAVGVRLEAIKALRYGHESDLTADEKFLAEFIRAVVNGKMTDDLWDRMVERLGMRGAVEYTLFSTYLLMTIRNIQTLVGSGASDEDIDRLIEELETGAREIPDPGHSKGEALQHLAL